jgi:cysteinyl-tRNA synthetase
LNNDLNTPLKRLAGVAKESVFEMADILGFRLQSDLIPDAINQMVAIRNKLRAAKDWLAADAVRVAVLNQGYEIRDNPNGTTEVFKNSNWKCHEPERQTRTSSKGT